MSELGTLARALRVAIVGGGPSGFFAAEALFKTGKRIRVDLFDRLPTPYGLVRGGVAPDHPKIRSVTRVFDKIAETEGFAFFGHVHVGGDITVAELQAHYDAIVLAYGAESDVRLGIDGEDLAGSHTATEFVGWYNAHPDFAQRTFDLTSEVTVVIGQGNVAVDVCRILAKTPDELRETDIADYALDALAASQIREIHLIGRRGPAQAKFTPAEIREFAQLSACQPIVEPVELELNSASETELVDPNMRNAQKNLAALREFASAAHAGKARACHIRFLRSPVRVLGGARVSGIELEHNALAGEPFHQKAIGTGEIERLDCGLVFRGVGYRGEPMPGVPFDAVRRIIPNAGGRVLDGEAAIAGLYTAGWIKRGPTGIIGNNKADSVETVRALIEDLAGLAPCAQPEEGAVMELLRARGVRVVSFADWQRIDAAEQARGQAKGKPRERFARIEEMLAVLDS